MSKDRDTETGPESSLETGQKMEGLVLLADDDLVSLTSLKRSLQKCVAKVLSAPDGMELMKLMSEDVSVAIVDLHMPKMSGLECLRAIKEKYPLTQVIVISGGGGLSAAISAIRLGAFWYLDKPFGRDELIALLDRAFAYRRLQADNAALRHGAAPVSASSFIGPSPIMAELMNKVGRISELDSTILLTGETGTGKSTLARLIHQMSPRQEEPFVMLNCSAVPQELIEAELFGFEKGSFTGASSSRVGCIEQADHGTLFLDEIGDLPLGLQPKLLTFLQERTIRRIGSSSEKKVDVRIIAASNRHLEEMVGGGRFREDLFYRVNVLTVTIPPLRNRKEDLSPLVTHILNRIAEKRGVNTFNLAESALRRLEAHDWPGNIRELENVLERATAFSQHSLITAPDIDIPQNKKNAQRDLDLSLSSLEGLTLDEIEQRVLSHTLFKCGGNRTKAAQALGISQKSVYNKMLRYKLMSDSREPNPG